jgi:hypothetical protein
MFRFAIVVVFGALFAAPVFAQQPGVSAPNYGGPLPNVQHYEQARNRARNQAMNVLSVDHRAKVSAVLARIRSGQLMTLQGAVQQIEAVLTPREAQAVISINADLLLQFETPPDGRLVVGPRPPPGARVVFNGNTPGLALLELNLNPNQIESLMGQSVMQSRYARPPR